MQKSALQYGEIIFQSKIIPLFLPKCSKLHRSKMYTIYGILYTLYGSKCRFFTLYGRECREEKKKAKYGEMRWTRKTVKIATSEIHISILKRNFTIL